MRPFLATLLLTTLILLACHKTQKKPVYPSLSNVWRWVSYSQPGGPLKPSGDSAVFLVLTSDSTWEVFIGGLLGSPGYYQINRDSSFMTFSTPALLYLSPDSLKLCTACAMTISRDTITLQWPTANPTNYGVFTFARPNPMPSCINCSR